MRSLSISRNAKLISSQVDENMHRAHRRDAVNTQKFYFRKNLYSPAPGVKCDYSTPPSPPPFATDDNITTSVTSAPAVPILLPNGLAALRPTFPPAPSACSSHGDSRSTSPTAETDTGAPSSPTSSTAPLGPVEEEYDEFTINEVINGQESSGFPGLMGVVVNYLDGLGLAESTRAELDKSLSLISRRANGQSRRSYYLAFADFVRCAGSLVTTASWMRRYVRSHPSYKFDSVISQEINYDLMKAVDAIERGDRKEPDLLPESYTGSEFREGDAFKSCCEDVVKI